MEDVTEQLSIDSMQGYTEKAVEMAMEYGPKLLLAILVLIIGMWIINKGGSHGQHRSGKK